MIIILILLRPLSAVTLGDDMESSMRLSVSNVIHILRPSELLYYIILYVALYFTLCCMTQPPQIQRSESFAKFLNIIIYQSCVYLSFIILIFYPFFLPLLG